ncbi:MAG: hypothetical protein ACJAZ2_002418 [Glaciecola sp.]|jgi:hypothetical protein
MKYIVLLIIVIFCHQGFSFSCDSDTGAFKLDTVIRVSENNEILFYVFENVTKTTPHCGVVQHRRNGKVTLS